jgi:SulP family sulfate permease
LFNRILIDLFPFATWGRTYQLTDFRSDVVAGTVVLFITVPQVIAYAFLAGMPAEAGLYAALFSLTGYALFGSSRALAVGPTAIVGMMTLEAASVYADPGTADYNQVVVQLCVVTGLVLILLRIVNFGSVISFLSHAVVTGFITAAALLIISNQFPSILGLTSSKDTSIPGVYTYLYEEFSSLNPVVLCISLGAVALLVLCKLYLGSLLVRFGVKAGIADSLVKSAPMYAVVAGVVLVRSFSLDGAAGVPVVGDVPASLPDIEMTLVSLEQIQNLLPSALLIAMVIFMESTSIGTAIASKSRDKINANQELVGLGAANLGSSLVGGFPVAGSFARSIVNYSSGAVTTMASLVTALLVLITILLFASLFYHLPKGVLSAIIVVSAFQLIDFTAIRKIFSFNLTDAVVFSFTFIAVLSLGVESGVLIGIVISFVLLIRSSSKPHIAVVGRVGDSEHFRNVDRYDVKTSPSVLAVRVDESLYFVNTRYIESFVLGQVADRPELEHVLLICTSTNFIDISGLEMLEELSEGLHEVGVTLHLAEVKGPVMDKLKETSFYEHMHGQVFFTTNIAMKELAGI